MKHLNWSTVHLSFKSACFIASAGMVFYWLIKYNRNEDVSVVEYRSLKTLDDAIYPEFIICIEDPLIDDRIKEVSSEISSRGYLKYLSGKNLGNGSYQHVSYENVTIDLQDHLTSMYIKWSGGSGADWEPCSSSKDCRFAKFKTIANGFASGALIYKCFGLQLNTSYAKNISNVMVMFSSDLTKLLTKVRSVYASFIYPQQLLQRFDGTRVSILNDLNAKWKAPYVKLEALEIIKRRNKPNQQCFLEWMQFDDHVLKQHIDKVGCRAPYMKRYKNFSLCDTEMKMKQSMFEMQGIDSNYLPPCQGISNLAITHEQLPNPYPGSVVIIIGFLDKIKIITQSRLVDIQALIGYIGGYIGLFMGKI